MSPLLYFIVLHCKAAMRRAGDNPTDVEMVSIINKYDNDEGCIDLKVALTSDILHVMD